MRGEQWLVTRLAAGLLAPLVLAALVLGCSLAPAYPSKAIEFVVPYAPGGSTDLAARAMGKYLSAELGVPVNISNKPGGNQIPAAMSVFSTTPDGYTLLCESGSTSSAHAITKDLPYKWDDRTFGPLMVESGQVFFVNGKSPAKTLKEAVDLAKKDPGTFTWSFLGGGSTGDNATAQLLLAGGVDAAKTKPVAFDGGAPAMTAVAGGHVVLGTAGVAAVAPLVASGDLRPLAITSSKRATSMPDLPTTREAGFPEVTMRSWWGISGPKNLPSNILERLDKAAKKIAEDPAFAKDLATTGATPLYVAPAEVRKHVMQEADVMTDIKTRLAPSK